MASVILSRFQEYNFTSMKLWLDVKVVEYLQRSLQACNYTITMNMMKAFAYARVVLIDEIDELQLLIHCIIVL